MPAACCYPPQLLLGSPVDRFEYRGHVGFGAAVMCKQSGPSAVVVGAAALSAAVAGVASAVAAAEDAAAVEVAVAAESVES